MACDFTPLASAMIVGRVQNPIADGRGKIRRVEK